jgi:hypothetical protein
LAIDEVIAVGNGPKIDLYSEIPMDAQLRAFIEGLKRDSCRVGDHLPGEVQLGERFLVSPRQSVTPRRLLLGSRDVRVRSVRAEIGEAKLFKLPCVRLSSK